jgi:hypothetical protein
MAPTPAGTKTAAKMTPVATTLHLTQEDKREAEDRKEGNPDQFSCQKPHGNAEDLRHCPRLRRRIALIDEEQQAWNPGD